MRTYVKQLTTDNAKYIRGGRQLVIMGDPYPEWISRANRKKNGAPFRYSEQLFMMAAVLRSMTGLSLRACQGMLEGTMYGRAPGWTTIHRRISEIKVDISGSRADIRTRSGDVLSMAADSTGMSTQCSGRYISIKWGDATRHTYLVLHVIIDTDDYSVLSARVTESDCGDAPQMAPMLGEAARCHRKNYDESEMPEMEILADGAYGSHANYEKCVQEGVRALISLR